jgi:hypothetical protein
MKFIKRVEDAVRGAAETTRTWFDPPLTSEAEPLEIREAIVDDVEQRVEPIDSGRRVLPFNRVSVVVLAPQKADRARLEAALGGLRDAIRARLGELQCSLPPNFVVDVRYIKQPRPEWTADQRLAIDYDARPASTVTTAPPGAASAPPLTLTVVRGHATQASYTLTAPQIHIGRTPKPVDGRGRPRLNHIVFVEGEDEHSRTVGRAHASIRFDAQRGEYRLFDDGSHNGTRVIRNGTSIDVVARDPTGVVIRPGDEIEFGTAAVRVEASVPDSTPSLGR